MIYYTSTVEQVINITASGTGAGSNVDQITIENSSPNIVQNVFQTIQVDGAATTTANTATDTLTIQGGTDITTSLNGDVITISYTGSGGGGGGSVNDAFKTIAISPSGGSVIADASEDTLTLENGNNIHDCNSRHRYNYYKRNSIRIKRTGSI